VSVFAGVVDFNGAPDRQTVERVGRAISGQRPGSPAVRSSGGTAFGQATSPPNEIGSRPLVGRNGRSLFTAIAILDNREEIGGALGLDSAALAGLSDPALVLQVFEHSGEAGVARLLGAFAFAYWDEDAGCLTLGRDCLGRASLFYHIGRESIAFATTLNGLFVLPGVPRELDGHALADFLALNTPSDARTFYRGIERVPSRTMVAIDRNGVRQRFYWAPNFDAPPPYKNEQDYVERARELFDQAVATAVRANSNSAIALSGGLDSSSVAATAARLGTNRIFVCYSVVPPDDAQFELKVNKYRSERDKVEALRRLYPQLDIRFLIATDKEPGIFDEARYFGRFNTPIFGPSNRTWFDGLLRTAVAAGHGALMTGRSGNFGLTWDGIFSLTTLLRSGNFGEFAKELLATAKQRNCGVARTFVNEVLKRGGPQKFPRLLHRLRGHDPYDVSWYSVLNPDFIADTKLASKWRAEGFDPWMVPHGRSGARFRAQVLFDAHQEGRDIGLPVSLDDLANLGPHGDRRLLEFALAVPEPLYRKNGIPRSFARSVFSDRLPPEILNERRRGAQAVTWFRSMNARRDDIVADIERLETSPLASRLIDVPRLKRLLAEWPKDEQAAEYRRKEYKLALARGIHVGKFIRWVEGGNS
jgi:asparagine synthase (glutamine-hydrolysing)